MSEAAHCARPAPRTCAVKGLKKQRKSWPGWERAFQPRRGPSEARLRASQQRCSARTLDSSEGCCPEPSWALPTPPYPPPAQPRASSHLLLSPVLSLHRAGGGAGPSRGPWVPGRERAGVPTQPALAQGAGGRRPPGCAWRRGAGPCCRLLSPRGTPQRRSWEWLVGM